MYRLRISMWGDDHAIVKSKHHKETKVVKLTGGDVSSITYGLHRACIELHRDIMYDKFCGEYRKVELKYEDQLRASILSAFKRARING
jgi:hypothetical protein